MSMVEIQEMTKRTARTMEEIDRAFSESAEQFFEWIPEKYQWSHPVNGVRSLRWISERDSWTGSWALRVTAKPMGRAITGNAQVWLKDLDFPTLQGQGAPGALWKNDLNTIRVWQPRLRAFERTFEGDHFNGVDRVGVDGQIERRIFQIVTEAKEPRYMFFSVNEFLWSVASIFCFVDAIRCQGSRPSQAFALEIELLLSHPLSLVPHSGRSPLGSQILPPYRVLFPRYEIGSADAFDELLTTIETDLWNSAGFQPDWKLTINWPKPKVI